MPSLFRFLAVLAVIAGVLYAGLIALVYFYDPAPREITVSIPPDKLSKQR